MSTDHDETRPDPDALLRAVQREQARTGRLKIFFGMSAGVGKTYAMLQEARRRREDGGEVVIGWLESHKRADTEALAEGMEVVPRMTLEHRGIRLQEMDVDAIVRRAPSLVLVDELAHTNAPGARNRKRYQDVLEIIGKGIDVLTTVNVQHLESFADTVEEVSGISILERIPDSLFDAADQVVLVDISPEELLTRLSQGKVYLGERAQSAAENFFKKSTLAMLREMALRHTALLVNHQLADLLQESPREAAPSSGERLLVAISASPHSSHLIRWTRQRAFNLKAEWTALYVETGTTPGEAAGEALRRTMNLARQLGAEVATVPAEDVALAVIQYARANGVTEIVVGKSGLSLRAPFLRRRTISERIMRMSGDIDIAVVQETGTALARPRVRLSSYLRPERASLAKAAIALAVVTGVSLVALPVIGYRSVSVLYLMTVIALAFTASRAAVIAAAVASAILWDFFFLPPRFTFVISQLEDILMFFLYFMTAAALAVLMARIRTNQRMLTVRERRLTLLVDFSQALSLQRSLDGIVRTGLEYIGRYVEAAAVVFLRDALFGLERTPHALAGVTIDEKEYGVARWCFDNRVPCGRYTDTLHAAACHYVPLLTPDAAVGVVGIALTREGAWLPEHEDALQMLARTLSLSIERELLAEQNRRNLMARESERLGRVLLNTVSHELRTPLTAIKGSVTALQQTGASTDEETRRILLAETIAATDRLNAIVENLLGMSRLESGMLKPKITPVDTFDLVSVVADALQRQSTEHPLSLQVDENVPTIAADFILMVQVLTNILTNAAKHTPAGTPVQLVVKRRGHDVEFTVSDGGPGVPPEELPHLFEPFFRGRGAAAGGVGLGLSLCKGIVEAHGGGIAAFANRGGGLSVRITLPQGDPVP